MKAPAFELARPVALEDALELLARHGGDAAILAGGQSLMPMMNLRMAHPKLLIDINRIPGLDGIALGAGGLRIGARARVGDVMRSPLVHAAAPTLAEACRHVAHPAIRNRGTVGGSLALADPAAEIPACAVCLGATVTMLSQTGQRTLSADAFFEGLYATTRRPDELLLDMRVPRFGPDWSFAFKEVARRHGDYAMAGLAFAARHEDGRTAECRIAFCGVEPHPRRLPGLESLISAGADPAAVLDGLSELDPMSSDDAPATYRRHLAGVLLGRAASCLAVGRVAVGRADAA